MEEFHLYKEEKDKYILLRPTGILDQEGADIFMESFMELLIHERKHMIIDMRNVQFIFSYALGILMNCYQEAAKRGKRTLLCEIPCSISRILSQINFDQVFEIHSTLSSAERKI